ncbi:uncharacterized protein CMU_019100 [Cryptosporidium muris RN66]|uniref:THH1/TOM1/TOM3 domain-containing protein n=1 Tax=Cryptosporidium muris (strain RN66) TaxID=441375 RepID=B6AC97_CRYMR|nr:uncharacterized protein CMU_019100 [Cryptosporidium muris RN66]EEA06153.1 hypothetical protein, conserved [Cryptosporidium muris RN66]|eukprot:XP_002140502.1 hypothetical protein [Cryptosporidium muris RN66]
MQSITNSALLNPVNYSINIGILSLCVLGLGYFALCTLAIIQAISTIQWNTITLFATSGTKTRPYFLNIFSAALLLRFIFIILQCILYFTPSINSNHLSIKISLLNFFNYLTSALFLSSYSVIIGLWSSVYIRSRYTTNIPILTLIILINIIIYILLSILLLIEYTNNSISYYRNNSNFFFGILYIIVSILWLYYGLCLINQLDKRQDLHINLQKNLLSKSYREELFTPSYIIDKYSNNNSSNNFSSQNSSSLIKFTGVDKMTYSNTLIDGCVYVSSTMKDLKKKIKLLTYICPLCFFIIGLYYILGNFNIINSIPFFISEPVWYTILYGFTELLPCCIIMHGFWNRKSIFTTTLNNNNQRQLFSSDKQSATYNYMNIYNEDIGFYTQIE